MTTVILHKIQHGCMNAFSWEPSAPEAFFSPRILLYEGVKPQMPRRAAKHHWDPWAAWCSGAGPQGAPWGDLFLFILAKNRGLPLTSPMLPLTQPKYRIG